MNTPEWLKPGIYGVVIGAIAVSIAGFSWGGWMTTASADTMAAAMAHNAVITALVPVCLNQAQNDPNRVAELATIKAKAVYQRQDAVMAAGWATVPGSTKPNMDLARSCATALNLGSS